MKYSICTDAVFGPDADIVESMRKVKETGYDTYEFWMWWTKDINAVKNAQDEAGIKPAAFFTKFAPLTDADSHKEYIHGLKETLEAARYLKCPTIISQTGLEQPQISREQQRSNLVQGLKLAAPLLHKAGITLVLEPLNTLVDHPGYFLTSSKEGFEIIDDVDSENVKLLFDIYHQQITEGNLIRNLIDNIENIGHIHAAGNPGRGTILEGEIDYRHVFTALDHAGYKYYTGLEYFPACDPLESLREIRAAFN